MTTLADRIWLSLPRRVPARARVLRAAMGDGAYLRRWPAVAVALPAVSMVAGLVCGWRPWAPALAFGIQETYTSSIPVLVLICVIGFLGAGNGVFFTVGYVVVDLLAHRHVRILSPHPFTEAVGGYAAALLTYVFLAALVVTIPLVTVRIARAVRLPNRRIGSAATLFAALAGVAVLVWCWTQTVPTLVRPVWTWQGAQPPTQAIQPLQHWWGLVLAVALVVTGVRVVLEDRALASLPRSAPEVTPTPSRSWPRAVSITVRTLVTTFVLSGLFGAWWEAGAFAALFAASLVLRIRLSQNRTWTDTVDRVPVVVRLLAAVVFSIVVGDVVVGALWHRTDSFLPVLASAALTLLLVAVLLPSGAVARPAPARTPSGVPS